MCKYISLESTLYPKQFFGLSGYPRADLQSDWTLAALFLLAVLKGAAPRQHKIPVEAAHFPHKVVPQFVS